MPVQLPVIHKIPLKKTLQSMNLATTQDRLQLLQSSENQSSSKNFNSQESLNYVSEVKSYGTANNQQFTYPPKKLMPQPSQHTTIAPKTALNNGQGLVLSPEHCRMVSFVFITFVISLYELKFLTF